MTKADVLDVFNELEVCTAYTINGKECREIPFQMDRQQPEPLYKKFAGWNMSSSAANSYAGLPDSMKIYVNYINEYLGVRIHYISNGPEREQIIEVTP